MQFPGRLACRGGSHHLVRLWPRSPIQQRITTRPNLPRSSRIYRPKHLYRRRVGLVSLRATAGVLGAALLAGCGATWTSVINDSNHDVRLSGCSIDDALDLGPGQVGTIDPANDGQRCSVFDENYRYVGCLTVRAGGEHLVAIYVRVSRSVTQQNC